MYKDRHLVVVAEVVVVVATGVVVAVVPVDDDAECRVAFGTRPPSLATLMPMLGSML
jgi:hypothetical protein